jgi:hypothetical protein
MLMTAGDAGAILAAICVTVSSPDYRIPLMLALVGVCISIVCSIVMLSRRGWVRRAAIPVVALTLYSAWEIALRAPATFGWRQ